MRRTWIVTAAWIGALGACGGGPSSPCADVSCPVVGTSCDETDGLCHCGAGGPVCAEGEACETVAGSQTCVTPLPAPVCTEGSRYVPGRRAFAEVTSEWGLDGVLGVRLNVADVDGDGWADLLVRRGAGAPEDFGPEGTRRTWLLRNTGAGFEDVTEASGLLSPRGALPEGRGRPVEVAAFADVDNDGDLDAYTGVNTVDEDATMGERSEILLNDGSGHFVLGPASDIRSPGRVDVPAGAAFVDVDRDGNVDLFVPQHNYMGVSIVFLQDRLFRGDGTGAFREITDEAGLATLDWVRTEDLNAGLCHSRAWGVLARDLNGDGWTELLVPSYGRSPNHLWRGAGDGTFVNESVASGYAYDSNMDWTGNQFARCYCQEHRTAEGCAEVPPPAIRCANNWNHARDREPYRNGGNSAATAAGDLDNDGDLDLFTGEIKHWWAGASADGSEALINDGALHFERPGDAALGLVADHLGRVDWDEGHMTNALFDFDNDGRLDVYVGASDYPGNRGLLYHQRAPLSFAEVPTEDFFEHNRSHGVVVADFDRDGDLDIVVGHSRARCNAALPNDCYATGQVRAFANQIDEGNWLQLELVGGEGSNRAAIGAQVTIRYGDLLQTLEVDGGHGHYGSQSDHVLHVGLGAACEAEVTVRWPDAALTTETHTLPAGHRFVLRQGAWPTVAP